MRHICVSPERRLFLPRYGRDAHYEQERCIDEIIRLRAAPSGRIEHLRLYSDGSSLFLMITVSYGIISFITGFSTHIITECANMGRLHLCILCAAAIRALAAVPASGATWRVCIGFASRRVGG